MSDPRAFEQRHQCIESGMDVVWAEWPEPQYLTHVQALTTTQAVGIDDLTLPDEPKWLQQIHGVDLIHLDDWTPNVAADAAWTQRPSEVAVVKTADCLPLLVASDQEPLVAAIHAGWRGLAQGMIGRAIKALPGQAKDLQVWIGPAISQVAYEVGDEVHEALVRHNASFGEHFKPAREGHWWADLVGMAITELNQAGVERVASSGLCTAQLSERFYSYRAGLPKNQESARMASLIWLA